LFLKNSGKKISKKEKEKEKKRKKNGVATATPLGPWGWLSHPQYPLGVVSATPLAPWGGSKPPPVFSLFYLLFFEKIYFFDLFFKKIKNLIRWPRVNF
jgi:hypothetical protein